jgi:hypothetical protein
VGVTSGSLLAEPVELRDRLRALAAVAPHLARRRLGDEMAEIVGRQLSCLPSDRTRAELSAACHGYGRELWLWLAGERTWQQCASGLEGRVLRRLGAGT